MVPNRLGSELARIEGEEGGVQTKIGDQSHKKAAEESTEFSIVLLFNHSDIIQICSWFLLTHLRECVFACTVYVEICKLGSRVGIVLSFIYIPQHWRASD